MRAKARFPSEGAVGMSGSSPGRGGACPPWCQLPPGHAAGPGAAGGITHRRLVREIPLGRLEAIRDASAQPVRVEVEAYTDPDGVEHPPTVRLTLSGASGAGDPDADDLTPSEVLGLAEALLEAVRVLES